MIQLSDRRFCTKYIHFNKPVPKRAPGTAIAFDVRELDVAEIGPRVGADARGLALQ